jgi:hypothetical protein
MTRRRTPITKVVKLSFTGKELVIIECVIGYKFNGADSFFRDSVHGLKYWLAAITK